MAPPDSRRPVVRTFVSHSVEGTEKLAAEIGRRARPGLVLALDGDLGSGKTAFVRGLARGLGAAPEDVASPTYTLLHEVPGRLVLYHFDAWMQGREEAFLEDGGAECFDAGGVAAVEWAERVAAYLPPTYVSVRLGHLGPEERALRLEVVGEEPSGGLAELVAGLPLPAEVTETTVGGSETGEARVDEAQLEDEA